MRVKLVTTVTTFIETDDSSTSYEEAKGEIFSKYAKQDDHPEGAEELLRSQYSAVSYDHIYRTRIEHTFEKVVEGE
jgi:hypothetical protein